MMWKDWCEWIGGGLEMAWERLRQDHALHWGITGLLDAFVEILIAFTVLVCTTLNFFTSSFVRISGFHIPCSCCVHFRNEWSVTEVAASQNSFLSTSESIGAAVGREPKLKGVIPCSEYVGEGELKSSKSSSFHDSGVETSYELPLEVLDVTDRADVKYASVLQYKQVDKDFNDRTHEDAGEEQYAKVQELLHALQVERETMAALYIELEQERNSSATAASEALAMISRLQEEKAAIQMESWQFQRMVMEKAMYDQEAIEVLKEILAKQEEERLDLKEEVNLYKEKLDEIWMKERHTKEITGGDHVPMHLLEGNATEGRSTSPTSERGELQNSERITHNGKISKERVTPHERVSEEERITADGRLVKEDKITSDGRPSKEERITLNGRLEDAEFLRRLSKTKSQLLTALLQEGFPEPRSAFIENSTSVAKEMHNAIAKTPIRAESLPILNHEHYKSALGLGSIKTGREIGLPIPPVVTEKQAEKALEKDAVRSVHEPVFIGREPAHPLTIAKKTEKARLAKYSGKVADDLISPIAEEQTEQVRAVKDDQKLGEPLSVNHETGSPIPPAPDKKQTETFVAKDAEKFADKPRNISREVSLPVLPLAVAKKPIEKVLAEDDRKEAGEPDFISLKRKWGSRSTKEISVETLVNAEEDRRMEEKRLSVLEYVRNLEKLLQQQVRRPIPHLIRARSADGREEDVRFRSSSQLESSYVSTMSVSSGGLEGDEYMQRRLLADRDSARKELYRASAQDGGDDKLYTQQYNFKSKSDGKVKHDEDDIYVNTGTEGNADEALFIHDVYETRDIVKESTP